MIIRFLALFVVCSSICMEHSSEQKKIVLAERCGGPEINSSLLEEFCLKPEYIFEGDNDNFCLLFKDKVKLCLSSGNHQQKPVNSNKMKGVFQWKDKKIQFLRLDFADGVCQIADELQVDYIPMMGSLFVKWKNEKYYIHHNRDFFKQYLEPIITKSTCYIEEDGEFLKS